MMRRSRCRRRLATRRASSNPGHLFPKKSLAQAYRKLTLVSQSLMIALAVIMSNEVLNGFPQRLLAEEDHAIQA
jgi:hypothetical protein